MRKFTLILGVAAMALLASSCQKLRSRDQLNKGVQAFKNAQYADAVESFKTAVELDPTAGMQQLAQLRAAALHAGLHPGH